MAMSVLEQMLSRHPSSSAEQQDRWGVLMR